MKRHIVRALIVALGTALAAGHAAAQQSTDQPRQNPFLRNPVSILVANAQILALTDSQTVQIRAIAAQLDTANAPLVDSLSKLRPQNGQGGGGFRRGGGGMGGGGMGGGGMRGGGMRGGGGMGGGQREMTPEQRQRYEQIRPLVEQLRQNNMAALMQVYSLLTPDQLQKAQSLLPQRQMGDNGGDRGGPPQP
jgi:Spy/CpxP family protein refolding chaperone